MNTGSPCLTAVAFLDAERKHAAALLGADQHQIGLHITGELRILVGREGEQHDGCGDRGETGEQQHCATLHRASPLPLSAAPRRPDRIGQELDIGGEQPVGIEVMVPLEQGAPKDRGERRRDQQLRKLAQARLAKLAALDAAVDQPGERLDAARDHLVVIEFGELGMLVSFGDHQPRDEGAL